MKALVRWGLVAIFLVVATVSFAAQCLGTTREGKQCRNQGASSGYCRYHDPAVKKCAATVKDGSPCRNPPSSGSAFCHVHKK